MKELHFTYHQLYIETQMRLMKTPNEHLIDRILLEAKRMQLNTIMHIKEIGYQVGFDDNSYFTRYFKRHTNSTPQQYKPQNKR